MDDIGFTVLICFTVVLTVFAFCLSFLFACAHTRNRSISSFTSFFCLTSLCIGAACFGAYAAWTGREKPYSSYIETFCQVDSISQSIFLNRYCASHTVVSYSVPDRFDCPEQKLISGHWMDVTVTEIPSCVCDIGDPGISVECIVNPFHCDTAILGHSKDPTCSTEAVDDSFRDCDVIPVLAGLVCGVVLCCCLLSSCTMILTNDCLIDNFCWISGQRWGTSYLTILLYIIMYTLTVICALDLDLSCSYLFVWFIVLITEGGLAMFVLFPFLLQKQLKLEFNWLLLFIVGVIANFVTSIFAYDEIWNQEIVGQCGLFGWKHDFIHFVWVFALILNILLGVPPLSLVLWECFLSLTESYNSRQERKRAQLFLYCFDLHLTNQKEEVLNILRTVSLMKKAD
eukprot:UN32934